MLLRRAVGAPVLLSSSNVKVCLIEPSINMPSTNFFPKTEKVLYALTMR